MTINKATASNAATEAAFTFGRSESNSGSPGKLILCTSLLVSALGWASLASAQGISGIGAFVPNTELGFTPVAKAGEPRINWINGEYQESNTDLSVKVLGGSLDIARSWSQGRWWLNPAWAPLSFELDPLGSDAKVIERVGVLYERSGQSDLYMAKSKGNAPVYIKRLKDAAGQHTGWQWYDRFGNTINYSVDGVIQSYANASGVKVSFAYDSATSARILDHFDKTIYTVTMTGGLITKIEDLAGRSVSYQWAGQRLAQVTDVMGHAWKYEYDTNGQITSRTDPLGLKISAQYIQSIPAPEPMLSLGKKGVTIDPTGTSGTTQKLANLWGGGRVGQFDGQSGCASTGANNYLRERRVFEVTYTDCRGNATVTQYDLQGNELSRTFNGKKTASNQWDGAYHQRYTNARGYSTTTTYDSNYQPLQITHPDGSVEKYTYEPVFGRQSSYTNQLGVVSTWRYDSKGNVTEWVEAKGLPEQRTTVYTYDQHSQLTSSTKGAGDATKADAMTQRWQYDSAGNVTAQTDGEGHTRKMAYDLRGAPTAQIDALNHTTAFIVDAAGYLTQITDPMGNATQMRYDASGRKTHIISPMGKTKVARYDLSGRVVESIGAGQTEGTGIRTEYDHVGQPIKTTSPGGLVTHILYDTQGRVVSNTDPAGNVTRYEYGAEESAQAGLLVATQYPTYRETYQYDQLGRQIEVIQHLSSAESHVKGQAFDALGQRVARIDQAGRTTLYSYDALGRVTKTIDATGHVTLQSWDYLDNLIDLTDANGGVHRFDYDQSSRVVKETRPLGGSIRYKYDMTDQLIQRIDADGNIRSYSYDQIGNVVLQKHISHENTLDESIRYSYNLDGKLSAYEQKDFNGNLVSSAVYTRDVQGNAASVTFTYGKVDGGTFNFTVGQSFNLDGQLVSHSYPEGGVQNYSYSNGQLSKIMLPNGAAIKYENYYWQVPSKIHVPGVTKSLTYDQLLRPVNIEVMNQASQLQVLRKYKYNQVGNVASIESEFGKIDYGYDDLDRLLQASPDNALEAKGLSQERYQYDAVGNRVRDILDSKGWSYNADNQLIQYPRITPFSSIASEDTLVAYTPQGHISKEVGESGRKDYSYNAAERLVEYNFTSTGRAKTNVQANYRYDPFGRRISKRVKLDDNNDATIYFIYSEHSLMAEANAAGEIVKAYGFNPVALQQGLWSTDPIWQANVDSSSLAGSNTEYNYLHTDHLATPILGTSSDGGITWKSVQQAFGVIKILPESSIGMNLRFPGQYFDEESGVNYNFHRDYDPSIGRYNQFDPLGIYGGVNVFSYAQNNPLGYMDVFGLRADELCVKIPFGPLIKRNREEIEEKLILTTFVYLIVPGKPELEPDLDPRDGKGGGRPRFPAKPSLGFFVEYYNVDIFKSQKFIATQYFQKFMKRCTYRIEKGCESELVTETDELPAEYVGEGPRMAIGEPFMNRKRRFLFRIQIPFLSL